ncbi:MAG: hypothetical protein WA958_08085 [Tunicatimonas sp.]
MKLAFLLSLLLPLTLIVACQSDDEATPSGSSVPNWLQDRVNESKAIVAADSTVIENYGAWVEVRFNGLFYYEYDNPLSSSSLRSYDQEGNEVNLASIAFTNYLNERCCPRYIWEGPRYVRLN